jgi:hypothetical protein
VIELYALTDHPGPPLPDVAPLHVVPAGDLGIICGAVEPDAASPAALWRRSEVVDALMEDRDLLPFRFGTRLADEDAAVRAVRERRDELAGALDRVRGAVELSLRVLVTGDEDAGPDYLEARRRGEAQADALHAPLGELARASVRRASTPRPELLRAAYLVDRGAVAEFLRAVAAAQAANPQLSLLCTGPWPPYSFTTP